ncbi:DUF502 domain-containing protein [Desulfohalobiaceae bacterium Ax17]|uniref:DUF502 domain-containing protein n=1 Tax=Desulfovulcanus ferrireducens TaxID=2831190 RepID=UPI00207BB42C|nr:DUF502 domain-containing protein [Desulfovulcanus ferrireducens]
MVKQNENPNIFIRFKDFLKTNLIAGLLFLTPIAATFYFLKILIKWLDQILLIIPAQYRPENFLPFPVPGLGVIVLVILLIITGFLVRNYLGSKLVSLWERIINKIPFINKFYTSVKQLIETLVNGAGKDFKRVVLVEFPRDGVYSLAYVTGVAVGELQRKTQKKVINVYVPTTPNPTSGYYLVVPEEDVIPLDMSVEDSFKLLISGGIINPEDPNQGGDK